jgi:hypothetical protein
MDGWMEGRKDGRTDVKEGRKVKEGRLRKEG